MNYPLDHIAFPVNQDKLWVWTLSAMTGQIKLILHMGWTQKLSGRWGWSSNSTHMHIIPTDFAKPSTMSCPLSITRPLKTFLCSKSRVVWYFISLPQHPGFLSQLGEVLCFLVLHIAIPWIWRESIYLTQYVSFIRAKEREYNEYISFKSSDLSLCKPV